MDALDIGAGIAQGLDRATSNFFAARNAVVEAKRQAAKDDIEMKKAQLDIKKLEIDTDPEVVAQKQEELKLKMDAAKKLNALRIRQISSVAKQTRQEVRDHELAASLIGEVLKDPSQRSRLGVSAQGLPYLKPVDAEDTMSYAKGIKPREPFRWPWQAPASPAAPEPAPVAPASGTDRKAKMKAALEAQGYDVTDEDVDKALELNPDFA